MVVMGRSHMERYDFSAMQIADDEVTIEELPLSEQGAAWTSFAKAVLLHNLPNGTLSSDLAPEHVRFCLRLPLSFSLLMYLSLLCFRFLLFVLLSVRWLLSLSCRLWFP